MTIEKKHLSFIDASSSVRSLQLFKHDRATSLITKRKKPPVMTARMSFDNRIAKDGDSDRTIEAVHGIFEKPKLSKKPSLKLRT